MATQTAAPTGKPGSKPNTAAAPLAPKGPVFADRVVAWVKAHRQIASWAGTIVVIAAALFVWTQLTKQRAEDIASRSLAGARFAFDNQNLPLAASELAKVIEDYSGTNAAQQGRLLLANVRLLQGQPQQAVTVLKDYAPGAGRAYRAQAFSLLGAAYENMGRTREAAATYEVGSAAARLDFLKAQLLADAGRAWTTAGDTTRAVAAYRSIVQGYSKEAAASEAKVRLAELTRGVIPK